MATEWNPAINDVVVLASDHKIRGSITQIHRPYNVGDPYFYSVQWKGHSAPIVYLKQMLILETTLSKIANKVISFLK
jgi:hypothetical protein